ncbi:MAG: hypothetical protein NTX73_08405 [Rhodobacterales bacterium]|nr:hypothetical protein [Rhodobacterales bacterium]
MHKRTSRGTCIVAGDADVAQAAMLAHVEHIRFTTLQAAELEGPAP